MNKTFLKQMYSDGRPSVKLRLNAHDQGIILRHGDGPKGCDIKGMREAIIFKENNVYHLFYDGELPEGWRVCLAVSNNLINWEKKGPLLELGKHGEMDAGAAVSPWVIREGEEWHMFYLATPNASGGGGGIPSFPYGVLKAKSCSLVGPWIKQKDVIPFRTCPDTYYSIAAYAGHVLKYNNEYMTFFSATRDALPNESPCVKRTLGIARTKDLDGSWTIDPEPIVPVDEQIENSSLYFEPACRLWFLFTNHVGVKEDMNEYTDAIWVYWSDDLNHWNPHNKAVVLDGHNCTWSKKCIGMPTVIPVNNRLAVFYDAPGGDSISHWNRDIGLAWLDLPLSAPVSL